MFRRSIPVVAALATLVAPLAAFAVDTATVTTGPASAAPALTMPLILLLAVVLASVAAYRLRLTSVGRIVGTVLVAAVTAAGLAYAGAEITISGPECAKQTTKPFDPILPALLVSNCPNPIHILAIQLSCIDPPPPLQPCTVGQTLTNGESCLLPSCGA